MHGLKISSVFHARAQLLTPLDAYNGTSGPACLSPCKGFSSSMHHSIRFGGFKEPLWCRVECRWTFTSSNPHAQPEPVGSAEMDFLLNSAHSLRPPSAFSYARGASVKSSMSSLSMSATNVRILRLEMSPPSAALGSGMSDGHDIGTFHQVCSCQLCIFDTSRCLQNACLLLCVLSRKQQV